MNHVMRKQPMWFPYSSHTNLAVQAHKWLEAGNFGFIKYYRCSGNKGTDQLHNYCEADLRLWFHIGQLFVFP